jgi:hypothetical protein
LFYINKKGKKINVEISDHALKRFIQRNNNIYTFDKNIGRKNMCSNVCASIDTSNARIEFAKIFNDSKIRINENVLEKRRKEKRNMDDVIYLINKNWRFIVRDRKIITAELIEKYQLFNNGCPKTTKRPKKGK